MDNWKNIGIAGDQDNIFLSATMTGNLQLIRLEHIGYFRYNSKCKQWEAVLCDKHSLMLKRNTNSQKILSYHPHLVQVSQSFINNCVFLPPFDEVDNLQITKPFMRKLKEKYPSI